MGGKLPLNLDDLLRQRTVEGDRIEYKAGWNPDAVAKTLCAFANDFENLGGGYVVIGQDTDDGGLPVFPPVGLNDNQLDPIQQNLHALCNNIQPSYFPVLSVEKYEGRNLIVLRAPGGDNRPYKARTAKGKECHYYIRRYSSTVELKANSEDEPELLRLTATVPFDDRRCRQADVDDLRPGLIQAYLKEVGSDLHKRAGKLPLVELGRRLNVVEGGDEFVKPRNVGVLLFHDEPRKFLPGAQIDVVIFPNGPGGGVIIDKTFHGPLHEQVRDVLRYLQRDVIWERVVKHSDRAEATRTFNYPFPAVEEAVVNAVYHRSYEQREPVEVRVNPDCVEIISYPGPDASIRTEALNGDKIVARRYRNRRIGEFLKELKLTEGRCTGIPTIRSAMAQNGSPPPRFSTDEGRTHFIVELPVHSQMPGVKAQVPAQVPAQVLTDTERRTPEAISVDPLAIAEIASALGHTKLSGGAKQGLARLELLGLIELTIPDKPRSRNQQRRLTAEGRAWLAGRPRSVAK